MGRLRRIQAPGGIYHVCAKGNRGCQIFADDYERRIFLTLLAKEAKRHRWLPLTHVLMTNHYHLLVQLRDCRLSDGMRELNGEFSRLTNIRHDLEGHLFRNRFWSEPIEDEAHLWRTVRYMVLNPLRAGICRQPEDWPWSSYRACAGLDFAPDFLAADELLRHFGSTPTDARRAYRRFVQEGVEELEREAQLGVRRCDESRADRGIGRRVAA